tara:strand:- start:16537 stop:17139 length:603 start_codon:yes stop_codon:yes gene_type:complete
MNDRISDLNLFFCTPVWTSIVPNFEKINQDLLSYIYSLKESDPEGIKRSNFKGWHSGHFNLENLEPKNFINAIQNPLKESFHDMSWDLNKQKVKITSMWSIINTKESLNERHIHGNNYISAAYYVKAPKNCGNIVFYDPRSAPTYHHPFSTKPNKLNSNSHSIEPKEGLLILFPSYIHHSVEVNKSDDERVVISFNITLS